MILERPWALALLVAIPVLWWLHRRRAPRILRVASVAPFRAPDGASAPTSVRRGIDPVLALLTAAVALLALAATGLRIGRPAMSVRVVVDPSPSMGALLAAPADGTMSASAAGNARRLLADSVPDASLSYGPATDDPEAALAAARADGFPGVVFVTDRRPPGAGPDVAPVGPLAPAGTNVAVSDVVLDGDVAIVSVRNFGVDERRVHVAAVGHDGRDLATSQVDAAARARASVRLPAPAAGSGPWRLRIRTDAPDSLRGDDEVLVERRGGARTARQDGTAPHVAAALRALGLTVRDVPDADVTVRVGGALGAADRPTVHLAPEPSPGVVSVRAVAAPRSVDASTLVRRGGGRFPVPAPSAILSATCRLAGGETLVEDRDGPLVVRDGTLVAIAFDPEDGGSDWLRDGSFVAALGAAIDLVTDGPDRLEVVDPFPRGESDVAVARFPDPEPAALLRLVRREHGGTDVSAAFAAAGALATIAALGWALRR